MTAFVTAHALFGLSGPVAGSVAALAASLIYVIERIVITSPSSGLMNTVRVTLGLLIALMGASTLDLVIFAPEVAQQLRVDQRRQLQARFDQDNERMGQALARKRALWLAAQAAANCEANDTCGSRAASTGPIYREAARQASVHQAAYLRAENG